MAVLAPRRGRSLREAPTASKRRWPRLDQAVKSITELIDEAIDNAESGNGTVDAAREEIAGLVQHIEGIESNLFSGRRGIRRVRDLNPQVR